MNHGARHAIVRLHGRRVGLLTACDDGTSIFRYDRNWIESGGPPISFSMPVQPEPFETSGLHPFFLGLLPEGWNRQAAVQSLGIDSNDDMGLLLATGADCIGAVEVVPVVADLEDHG